MVKERVYYKYRKYLYIRSLDKRGEYSVWPLKKRRGSFSLFFFFFFLFDSVVDLVRRTDSKAVD